MLSCLGNLYGEGFWGVWGSWEGLFLSLSDRGRGSDIVRVLSEETSVGCVSDAS